MISPRSQFVRIMFVYVYARLLKQWRFFIFAIVYIFVFIYLRNIIIGSSRYFFREDTLNRVTDGEREWAGKRGYTEFRRSHYGGRHNESSKRPGYNDAGVMEARGRAVESCSADNVGPTRVVRDLFMARRVPAETGSYVTVYCTHQPTASREPLFQFRKFPNRVCPSSCTANARWSPAKTMLIWSLIIFDFRVIF